MLSSPSQVLAREQRSKKRRVLAPCVAAQWHAGPQKAHGRSVITGLCQADGDAASLMFHESATALRLAGRNSPVRIMDGVALEKILQSRDAATMVG